MKRFTIFAAMLAVLLSSSTAIAQESYKVFDTSLFDGSISNDGGVVDFRLTMQIPAGQSFQASFGMSGFSLVPLEEKEIDVKLEIDGEEKAKAETTLDATTGIWRIDFYTLTKPKEDAGKGYGTKVLELALNQTEGLKKVTKVTGFLGEVNKKKFVDGGGKDDDLDGLGKTPLGKSMKTLGFKPKKIKKENGKWEFEFEPCGDGDNSGDSSSSPMQF